MDDRRLAVIEQILTCTNCELHTQCTAPVAFRGHPAKFAIIGEAPGETEDRLGQPFVGPAGRLLTDLLAEVGLTGDHAFVNAVSCLPHGTPTWDHVDACEANKWAQINYLQPRYLLLVGRVALKGMRRVLDLKARSRPFRVNGIWCFATYHPAAALRNHNFEEGLRADLRTFATMLDLDDPLALVPDNCAACEDFAQWWEADSVLGWCPRHIPESERVAFINNQTRITAQTEAARAQRDAGLAQVDAAADPDWKARTWDCLVTYLCTHREFFVDDFWADAPVEVPRESRALGPLVQRAAREKLIVKTDNFRKSVRSNMTEKPVWLSLMYGKVIA